MGNFMTPDPEYDARRQKYNRFLVKKLAALVEAHPSQRFGQILQNYGFVSLPDGDFGGMENYWTCEHHLEPWDLWVRVGGGAREDDRE